MSTPTATVVTGYEFTADAENKIQVTMDRLNLLGVPTVSVPLSDTVELTDLTTAVLSLMPKVSVTAGPAEGDGTMLATIQVLDASGATLAGQHLVRAWVSLTDKGTPHAMTTSFLPTTGIIVGNYTTVAANSDISVITDTSGTAVIDVKDVAGTVYVMAEISGLVFSATLVIT